jgi:hypothetical protein
LKKTLPIILAALLALASCAPKTDRAVTEFAQLREHLAAAANVTATAAVTADYGERVFDFRIKYQGADGAGEITILAPESLLGITARVADNAGTLKFDGAALDTGSLGDGISPAGIIPRLLAEWRSGFPDSLSLVTTGGRAELVMRSALTADARQTTRFDLSSRLPVRTEITSAGRVILTVVFENVTLT